MWQQYSRGNKAPGARGPIGWSPNYTPLTRKAAMYRESNGVWAGMVLAVALLGAAPQPHPGVASTGNVKLSEWNVVLSQASVAAGAGRALSTKARGNPPGLQAEGRGRRKRAV